MTDRRQAAAQQASQPLLRVASVVKRFGSFTAVDRLSLDIRAGEFFALLGPSGCGKTTLLRMLAGFEAPDDGQILLDGTDIAPVPPYRRPVNMMFQSYALFPHMTVADNVAFGLRRAGMPKPQITARVKEMLALVRLEELAARKPDQLSGGQRQRVALARALARRPRILLLDEPLAALDKKLRESTQAELLDVQRRLGTTFVIVTHDQEEAMTVADRIGVMDRGRLVQVATPRDLYEAPNSRWIAGFVGDINMIEATVVARGVGEITVAGRDAGPIVATAAAPERVANEICIAIRPEKIRLGPADTVDQAERNRLTGEVLDVTYLGAASVCRVKLDRGCVLRVSAANGSRGGRDGFAAGQRVVATFAPDSCVVLEA